MKRESPPSSTPSLAGAGGRRGPDEFTGAWGCSPGGLQESRGKRLASALFERKGDQPGGGLEVEGRQAAHRCVR